MRGKKKRNMIIGSHEIKTANEITDKDVIDVEQLKHEEELFEMEQQLDIPHKLRYYNKDKKDG